MEESIEECIAKGNMAQISPSKRLKMVFQLSKKIKQTLVTDNRSSKLLKEVINHKIDDILMLITEQSNMLFDARDK